MAIQASAVYRLRKNGSNSNGGGYDPGITGAGTDYSQQNAAQASWTNLSCTGSASTTLTDASAGGLFTSAMVGNAINITSGTGFTAGIYYVITFTDANNVVLDRSPASAAGAATVGHGALGGGWLNFDNCASSLNGIVPGNKIYILGSGIPNPSSYVADITATSYIQPVVGSASAGRINVYTDPLTPSYSSGGMALVACPGLILHNIAGWNFNNIWFYATTTSGFPCINGGECMSTNCIFDQHGNDTSMIAGSIVHCEIFSSVAGTTHTSHAYYGGSYSCLAMGCNIHDCIGYGVYMTQMEQIIGNIIAKNAGGGIYVATSSNNNWNPSIINNTIDGNTGNGITLTNQYTTSYGHILNNIISNNTGTGLSVTGATQAVVDSAKKICDYNVFYNNGTHYSGISAGSHDQTIVTTPYVASATENYTLA